MKKTKRNGITFEYVPYIQWITIRDHVNRARKFLTLGGRGVNIIYPCGTKRFISNDFYSDEDIKAL